MNLHHHKCCGHGRADSLSTDPRFEDDDFTQAAARERRAYAAHAHGIALLLTVLGGLCFFGIAKKTFRNDR